MESSWFWRNYEICQKWQKTHSRVLMEVANANRQLNGDQISSYPISTARVNANHECNHTRSNKVISELKNPIRSRLNEQQLMEFDEEEAEYSCDDLDLKFEVNQEFLDFLEISMKHKQELREKRIKEEGLDQDITQNEKKGSRKFSSLQDDRRFTPAPDCPIGKKRLEEMKLLYGNAAQTIQGMETALQLSFNKKCDSTNPGLWPVGPLNSNYSY